MSFPPLTTLSQRFTCGHCAGTARALRGHCVFPRRRAKRALTLRWSFLINIFIPSVSFWRLGALLAARASQGCQKSQNEPSRQNGNFLIQFSYTKSAILEACRPPGRPDSPGGLKITERAKGPKQTQNFKFCARCLARYVIERAAAWQS